MSNIESATNFLWCCIEYADNEDLTTINEEEAISQVDGYRDSFGDELPELLNDPYWFKVCWNRAVKAEIKRRFGDAKPITQFIDQQEGPALEKGLKASKKLILVFQEEKLSGPRKIYRDTDGNLWEDYIVTCSFTA